MQLNILSHYLGTRVSYNCSEIPLYALLAMFKDMLSVPCPHFPIVVHSLLCGNSHKLLIN